MNDEHEDVELVELDWQEVRACAYIVMTHIISGKAWPGRAPGSAIKPKRGVDQKKAFAEISAMVTTGCISLAFYAAMGETEFFGEREGTFIVNSLFLPGAFRDVWKLAQGPEMVLKAAVQMAESLK